MNPKNPIPSAHPFWAHTPNEEKNVPPHMLKAHLEDVTARATNNAQDIAIPHVQDYLKLAGLLHDLGKYKLEFQRKRLSYDPLLGTRVTTPEGKVDHSSMGAVKIFRANSPACVLISRIIAAHHAGLSDTVNFEQRIQEQFSDPYKNQAWDYFKSEFPNFSAPPLYPLELASKKSQEFLTRMMLSCLVDADQTDTEAHCDPQKNAIRSRKVATLEELWRRLSIKQEGFKDVSSINKLRSQMYQHALEASQLEQGIFRLTMPTGGGKTRTSLAFALKHALKHNLKRVIYAIPFTSIIDQTADVFRGILNNNEDEENILEHHSALELDHLKDETPQWIKMTSATWDAPLIVTTTVQLFESLFANKTSKLRKLHNIAGSVIILDEVQALPTRLLKPILDALNELVSHYRVTVVLCTATQPALEPASGFDFPELHKIQNIIPNPQPYFDQLERVNYTIDIAQSTPWKTVGIKMLQQNQVLTIVNMRRHAQELYGLINKPKDPYDLEDEKHPRDTSAIHLSTYLFPLHRKLLIKQIRRRLKENKPCRVVSTTLIECGVDVDFPRVFRALGPLDAIVQAAGRCNRENTLEGKGEVWVFKPEDAQTPKGDYFVKVQKAEKMLAKTPNLNSAEVFQEYFRDVYLRSETDAEKIQQLREDFSFEQVAQKFKMIDSDTVSVIVTRIHAGSHTFTLKKPRRLLAELEATEDRIRRSLWQELQMYTVSIFRSSLPKMRQLVRQVVLKNGAELDIYEWTGKYDHHLGILLEGDVEQFNL
jgi:CRISPR-associated endonuclease/helicase Cas3